MKRVSRRTFLKESLLGLSGLMSLGLLRPRLAFCQSYSGLNRNLISIFLRGGPDGLSVCPYESGPVADLVDSLRPNIAIPRSSILMPTAIANAQNGIPDKIGLHPIWAPLTSVAGDKIRIMQSIGTQLYVSGSHEEMTNIHHIGAHQYSAATAKGWLARLKEAANLTQFSAWGVGYLSPDVRFATTEGDNFLLLSGLNAFNYYTRNFGGLNNTSSYDDSMHARQVAIDMLNSSNPQTALEQTFKAAAEQTHDAVTTIAGINSLSTVGNYLNQFGGTSNFAGDCRDIAKILMWKETQSSLKDHPAIIATERGGWDTHGDQISAVANNVTDLAEGLRGLVQDLSPNANNGYTDILSRTVIVLYGEFGRTNRENGGQGTDHAWASNTLVIGGSVNPGVAGSPPPLSDLTDNNRMTSILNYTSPIEAAVNWLGIDQTQIFPNSLNPTQWQTLQMFT
ncbi:MAG: DUF1501 domain-containing protein [Bdellovibrionales bacterium]|nr:DUF1501 domain-containing protein [Bdellovibrionales bacterium]